MTPFIAFRTEGQSERSRFIANVAHVVCVKIQDQKRVQLVLDIGDDSPRANASNLSVFVHPEDAERVCLFFESNADCGGPSIYETPGSL